MRLFTSRRSESLASLGETKLIRAIRGWLGAANPAAPRGIGDDCAVLEGHRGKQLVTVDPVVFGRHFDETMSAADVGAKLLKRNLSDIAAMGGRPTAAVVALATDSGLKIEWLAAFYRGLSRAALQYGVSIVGGDVTGAPAGTFVAALTLLGVSSGSRVLTRTGARIGDRIYVTGALGGSLLGGHLHFEPRLKEGAWLAKRAEVRSMMDVSDGLAKDLHSLTPAGARADLHTDRIPVSKEALQSARKSGRSPIAHALCDGEDYELVFSLRASADFEKFERAWRKTFRTPLTCVGVFTKQSAAVLPGHVNLNDFRGYEHLL